jgi:hypothetical protein
MTTPTDPSTERQPNVFDPFPEPRTIPAGWDLSDMLTKAAPVKESDRPRPLTPILNE